MKIAATKIAVGRYEYLGYTITRNGEQWVVDNAERHVVAVERTLTQAMWSVDSIVARQPQWGPSPDEDCSRYYDDPQPQSTSTPPCLVCDDPTHSADVCPNGDGTDPLFDTDSPEYGRTNTGEWS